MIPVLRIKITKDMSIDDIKQKLRDKGIVGFKTLTDNDRIIMREIAKQEGCHEILSENS